MSLPAPTTMGPPGHITSAQEPYPSRSSLASATTTHRQGNFLIRTRKLPISKAGPIEALEADLGIPVPEMIFGDNLVGVTHAPSGWSVEFGARDALDAVDKTGGSMLQVSYAGDWTRTRSRETSDIKEVVKPFDWSYSTTYAGTVSYATTAGGDDDADGPTRKEEGDEGRNQQQQQQNLRQFQPTDRPIPIELLKRRDPILFFDEVVLYESELDDNGISVLSVKVRVHERRMLLLARLFMRLDNVLLRVRDTRVYIDFATDEVTREYAARECGFEDAKKGFLMQGLRPDEVTVAMRDANRIAELRELKLVDYKLESVSLAP